MRQPVFQVFRSEVDYQYYFHLRASNGKIILSSEGYRNRANCLDGINSVKKNSILAELFRFHNAPSDYNFVLKSSRGVTLGRSECYTSAVQRDNGIRLVMLFSKDAPVIG